MRPILCLCLLFASVFIDQPALAQDPDQEILITDPSNTLSWVSRWMAPGNWEKEATCGQTSTYWRDTKQCNVKCFRFHCESICTPAENGNSEFDLATEDCSSDELSIYGNGLDIKVLKSEYQDHGTWILGMIRRLRKIITPIYSAEIFMTRQQRFIQVIDGRPQVLNGQMVSINITPTKGTANIDIEIGIVNSERLLDRLVYVGKGGQRDIFLLKKGVQIGNF